jgi:hypothetical protein
MDNNPNGSEIDAGKAIEAMRLYGLDPSDEAAVQNFARAYTADADRKDPHTRDRYTRAARTAATTFQQIQQVEKMQDMGVRAGNLLDGLGKIAFTQAKPLPPPPETRSIFDAKSSNDLWDLQSGKVVQDPDDALMNKALQMQQAAGTYITDEDPEAQQLQGIEDPDRFLQVLAAAIETKRARQKPDPRNLGDLWTRARFGGK